MCIPCATSDLLLKHLDTTVATYKRRQMKHLKQVSETFTKTPGKYEKHLRNISSHYLDLGLHTALVPLNVSFGHDQTTPTDVGQAFLQLVLPLDDHVYHRSKLGPSLCDHKSSVTYAFS